MLRAISDRWLRPTRTRPTARLQFEALESRSAPTLLPLDGFLFDAPLAAVSPLDAPAAVSPIDAGLATELDGGVALVEPVTPQDDEAFDSAFGLGVGVAVPGDGGDATLDGPTPPGQAPVIQNFDCAINGDYATFTGTVVDNAPAGLTVRFGGIASLMNQTATTTSTGTFSITIQLQPGTPDIGTASSQTTDGDGLDSNIATVSVDW